MLLNRHLLVKTLVVFSTTLSPVLASDPNGYVHAHNVPMVGVGSSQWFQNEANYEVSVPQLPQQQANVQPAPLFVPQAGALGN